MRPADRSCHVCDLCFDLVLGMKTTFTAQSKEHGLLPDGPGGPMGTAATYFPESHGKDSEKSADTSRDYELHLVRKNSVNCSISVAGYVVPGTGI